MDEISVQVCYATPDRQVLRQVDLPAGATLRSAIEHAGIASEVPEFDLDGCRVGVFGKLKTFETVLRDRDRVEIYRPLIADPMESRRRRAEKKDEKKAR